MTTSLKKIAGVSITALTLLLAACDEAGLPIPTNPGETPTETEFTLRIENVSNPGTLSVADPVAVPLSPGTFVVGSETPFFTVGEAASAGLIAIAEDGNSALSAAELDGENAGVFNTPVGADAPGPIGPEGQYTFEFQAEAGDTLNFATMFIQSNDWFYAPDPAGIPLFDEAGEAISGDISDQVLLWDAGSEIDQIPGFGPDQAPRQAGPDTGEADADTNVREVPAAARSAQNGPVLETTIESETVGEVTTFTVTLANVSSTETLTPAVPVPLSPGVWTLGDSDDVLLTVGEADKGEGLEGIAEDGDPSSLAAALESQVSQVGVFNTPVNADEPGPIRPGGAYEATFTAEDGDKLNLTTMFIQSNDWVYATREDGVALFENGEAVTGDISEQLGLYDVGTEADETPGLGENQAPRQAGPDTGEADPDTAVRAANVALNGQVIRVTLSTQ